jgi:hypothetical protein
MPLVRAYRFNAGEVPPMIEAALTLVCDELDRLLRQTCQVVEPLAILSSLVERDGSIVVGAMNKIVMFVANIASDTNPGNMVLPNAGAFAPRPPPMTLTVTTVFAANFSSSNYAEGLRLLSDTISFFEARPIFDQRNTDRLSPSIERVSLTMQNLDPDALGQLWGISGGHYIPSVVYRICIVPANSNGPNHPSVSDQ